MRSAQDLATWVDSVEEVEVVSLQCAIMQQAAAPYHQEHGKRDRNRYVEQSTLSR